jgi:predicted ester cyclase
MTAEANVALLRRAWAAFDRADGEAFANCVTDGWVEHLANGETSGIYQLLPLLLELRTALSDVHTEIDRVVADHSTVACHCTITATHTGPFRGIAATGTRVVVHEMMFNEVDNGRLRETWTISERPGLLEQISGSAAPG